MFGDIEQRDPPDHPAATRLASIVDNIGLPTSSINTVYNNSGLIGSQDGDIYVSLKQGPSTRPRTMCAQLRERLPRAFPGTTFSFLPADIISQILNFGSPAPHRPADRRPEPRRRTRPMRSSCCAEMRTIPGVADARMQQSLDNPQLRVDVDRSRMAQLGLTERDVTNSVVTSLAGSSQTAPTFWLNPKNGVSYPIVAQTPEYRVDSLSALAEHAGHRRARGGHADPGRPRHDHAASNPARWSRTTTSSRSIDLYATTQDRDLGGVARDIQQADRRRRRRICPRARRSPCAARSSTMNTAFSGLSFGLLGAIVLIYLLIVVNFQSWLDPFVIITALPAALAGIVWMLFATGTTLVGAGADRRDHVHGRGDRQLHPGGQLRARAAGRHRRRDAGRDRSRLHALPSRC